MDGIIYQQESAEPLNTSLFKDIIIAPDRARWEAVAQGFNAIGWDLTGDLLSRSLSSNPQAVVYDETSAVSQKIVNNAEFNAFIKNNILAYENGSAFSTYRVDGQFNSDGDLLFAIHNYNIQIQSQKNADGTWKMSGCIDDVFDFTQLVNPLTKDSVKQKIGWAGNDVAYFHEKAGVINKVPVYIKLNFTYSQ